MTVKPKSLEAWYAALTVGGRLNQERSRARERRFYGDPSRWVKFEREKGMAMRHIAKSESDETTFAKREPVDKVLDIWADYLRLRDSNEPGGYSNPQDVKDFMRLGEAVEAMVNDLRRHQWWAIRKSRGICTQWIFKDAIYEDALAEAKKKLEEKMRTHIATSKYFN
jgi:hypothetical protein